MTDPRTIEELRAAIDQTDREIVERIHERARLALAIGEVKKRDGKAVFDPAREKQVIERVTSAVAGPFPAKTLAFVYREIIAACRGLEEPTRVAYLGPEASFSHAAALRKFGSASTFFPQVNFADVFREVERGNAAYGIVPIENSIEGAVSANLDLLVESELRVVGEVYLEVSLNLLSKEGDFAAVKTIFSHPQPFGQARLWLQKHVPHAQLEQTSSTAEAAKLAAERPNSAAIGSVDAAAVYGLRVLARAIEDIPYNVTRFLVLGREGLRVGNEPKTSLIAHLKDEPGVLARVLQPLAGAGVNLTKIESRPLKKRPWEYRFFIDVDGDPAREPLRGALAQVEQACTELRVLGTYDKAPKAALYAAQEKL